MNVLVIGKHGQLASEIRHIAVQYPLSLHFVSSEECDIRDIGQIRAACENYGAHAIINTAAYTAVDAAEDDPETAFAINYEGVANIDRIATEKGIKYIHISTDYVFDGRAHKPYRESDETNPLGVYGKSKKAGEDIVLNSNADAVVIRTAWLYSSFGKNFLKTMLHLAETRKEISVVNDQFGTPTYTRDLAEACLMILANNDNISEKHRLYHFANSGIASWYDFAKEIFTMKDIECAVNPIPSDEYPTKAIRPKYSVLSTQRIQGDFGIRIRDWKDSLKSCLAEL